jgi:hypothetical protein
MLQRLVNQRRQGSFRGGAWFPRLPDHCRENSPTSRGEGLLVLLQAGQHGEIALIQYRVGNLVLRLTSLERISGYDLKRHVFCPCSISRSVPRRHCALFLCERWHSQIVRMERANHSLCGVTVSHANVEADADTKHSRFRTPIGVEHSVLSGLVASAFVMSRDRG